MKYFLFLILLTSCLKNKKEQVANDPLMVSYNNPNIVYEGRVDSTRIKGVDLFWSGTSVKLYFKGTSVAVELLDAQADNYYDVVIDDKVSFILETTSEKKFYTLAEGLKDGDHSVELFKRTEWDRGRCTFFGFKLSFNAQVLSKPAAKVRKIEFYGNSITAAYAVEDVSGNDSPDSIFTNNHKSYAYLTAKYFDAQYSCICKSGIGIMVSWMPIIMPEIYDRLDPFDPESQWDFSKYTPDLVVINLSQNDSWLVKLPTHDQFKNRFGDKAPFRDDIIKAYKKFVGSIRIKYPNAQLICALGSMDITKKGSPWPEYIKTAVKELNDPNIHTHFIPYKNSPGHPNEAEQKVMSESLIKFIETNIEW